MQNFRVNITLSMYLNMSGLWGSRSRGKKGILGRSGKQGGDLPICYGTVDVPVAGEGEVPDFPLLPVVIGGVVAEAVVEHGGGWLAISGNMSLPHWGRSYKIILE